MPANAKDVAQLRRELKNCHDKIDDLEGRLTKTMQVLYGLITKLKENPHVARILDTDPQGTPELPVQSPGAGTNESGG